jgi:hypothetical protein
MAKNPTSLPALPTDEEKQAMLIVALDLPTEWKHDIAGGAYTSHPQRIPLATWAMVMKDRLSNKGKDAWADASKIGPGARFASRADAWQSIMDIVYSGGWTAPGGRAASILTQTFDDWLVIVSENEAKAMSDVKKKTPGYKAKSGRVFRADSDADVADLAAAIRKQEAFIAAQRLTYDAAKARAMAKEVDLGL